MGKNDNGLICTPLDSVREIQAFLQNPPAWRSLCVDLKPHSKYLIKNSELTTTRDVSNIQLEKTPTFCHLDPDNEAENVLMSRFEESSLPRTLVCHDMANGYHDDSYVDGTGNHTAYTFYHWAGIDIFCYFSHHLVTVPPLSWINVAHAHGVKVIGTVITEWGEGTIFWEEVLSTDINLQNFISVLVAIAKTLKFEGWLLNIENKVTMPQRLVEFVRGLHQMLHEEVPHAVLLWYDSVTINGQLNWQNQLNEKNKAYFEACDGFFTNYSWIESDLDVSVAAAGDRLHDLFIGMDVWGRNFHGGGMFNLQEAMKLAHSRGCSVAIFGPAWTREALAVDVSHHKEDAKDDPSAIEMGHDLTTLEQFLLRDRALWDSIWPFLNTRLPSQLPFQTSFCRGQGEKRRLYGEVMCPVPWYNLRHQQYQPNSAHGPHGYLLSTHTKLMRASRQVLADKTGIMKYREELYKVTEAFDVDDEAFGKAGATPALSEEDEEESKNAVKDVERKAKKVKRKSGDAAEETEAAAGPSAQRSLHLHEPSIRIRLSEGQSKTRLKLAFVPDELPCIQSYYEDSFNGGSCVRLNPSDAVNPGHRFARLFQCDFECEDTLVVCLATKTLEAPNQYLTVHMYYATAAEGVGGAEALVVLVCRPLAHAPTVAKGRITVYPENMRHSFKELQTYLLLTEPGFYVPVENSFGWNVWYFCVPLGCRARVSSVNCLTGCVQGALLLGHFALCNKKAASASALPLPLPLPARGTNPPTPGSSSLKVEDRRSVDAPPPTPGAAARPPVELPSADDIRVRALPPPRTASSMSATSGHSTATLTTRSAPRVAPTNCSKRRDSSPTKCEIL